VLAFSDGERRSRLQTRLHTTPPIVRPLPATPMPGAAIASSSAAFLSS